MPLPRMTIECRVAADPELRFSQAGNAVCRLRVVASDRRKNPQTNEWEDGDTLWMNVTCFKQMAENTAESVVKGDLLVVHGKLRTDTWETQDGEKRSNIQMIADVVAPSLQFRAIPHGAGRAERTSAQRSDPWAAPPPSEQADEPPF